MRHESSGQLLWVVFEAAGLLEGVCRDAADGDVIRVTIAALRVECEHDVGLESSNELDNLADQNLWVDLGEGAVHVVQAQRMLHSQALAGEVEFPLPDCAQCPAGGGTGVTYLAPLALRE